jgi:hypothetical protein
MEQAGRRALLFGWVVALGLLWGCGDRPWYQKRLAVVAKEAFPDSQYEVPLPGCTVAIKETTETLTTDSQGRATFFLDPGDYTVSVTKSGYTSAQVMVSITYWGEGTVVREVKLTKVQG